VTIFSLISALFGIEEHVSDDARDARMNERTTGARYWPST
jgi:hypothetical protein